MAAAVLMSTQEWLTKTNRKAWHGRSDKERSDDLKNIDIWLGEYNTVGKNNPRNLILLKRSLDSWINSKTKGGNLSTIRNKLGAVSLLKNQVEAAMKLKSPKPWKDGTTGIFIARDRFRGDSWVPDDFVHDTEECLRKIASKPVGAEMLKAISARYMMDQTKKITIEYTSSGAKAVPTDDLSNEFRFKIQIPVDMGGEEGFVDRVMTNQNIVALAGKGTLKSGKIKDFIGNKGSGAVVCFNHKDPGNPPRPPFIALAHELVHAFHYVHGACYRGIGDKIESGKNAGIMEEEMRTVGFGKYKNEVPSENTIRDEHGIARRPTYVPGDKWKQVTASIFA